MRILFAAAAIAALIATPVSARPNRGEDGYVFERKEWTELKFQTEIVLYPDLESLGEAAEKLGIYPDTGNKFAAFSVFYRTRKICVIHMVDPGVAYMPEQIGHELAHCGFGNFHPSR